MEREPGSKTKTRCPSLRRKRKSLVAVSFSFWLIFNTLRSQSSDIHPIKGGISEKCGLLSLVIIR